MVKLKTLKIWTDAAFYTRSQPHILGLASVRYIKCAGVRTNLEARAWTIEAKTASSMHAELFAIQRSLEAVPKELKGSCRLIILTDCLSAVNAIKGGRIRVRHRKVVTHIRALMNAYPRANIIWCRAHSGLKYNELANHLAQKAAGTWVEGEPESG